MTQLVDMQGQVRRRAAFAFVAVGGVAMSFAADWLLAANIVPAKLAWAIALIAGGYAIAAIVCTYSAIRD